MILSFCDWETRRRNGSAANIWWLLYSTIHFRMNIDLTFLLYKFESRRYFTHVSCAILHHLSTSNVWKTPTDNSARLLGEFFNLHTHQYKISMTRALKYFTILRLCKEESVLSTNTQYITNAELLYVPQTCLVASVGLEVVLDFHPL